MKRNRSIAITVALGIILLSFMLIVEKTTDKDVLYTNDVNNYNSNQYRVPLTIFPDKLPSNANVISFVYYNFWNEAGDIYLELRFDTAEDMEDYLFDVKNSCLTECENYNPPKNGKWFIETQNVYNPSYQEMFCAIYNISKGEETYTGYAIESTQEKTVYTCNFGLIAYSYEELTVIHTNVYGYYQNNIHNYVPVYLKKFAVPLQEDHERYLYLEW